MIRDRALRERVLALRCGGCAFRKGTPAHDDRAAMPAIVRRAAFYCHKWIDRASDEAMILADPCIQTHGGLCAGHVARAFDDEAGALWADGGRREDSSSAWVEASFYTAVASSGRGSVRIGSDDALASISYQDVCGHLHRTVYDAWLCAIYSSDPYAEPCYFDSWPLLLREPDEPGELNDVIADDGRRYAWARPSPLNERQQEELRAELAELEANMPDDLR